VYEFRQHGDSLSAVRRPEQFLAMERLLKRHIELGKAKPWQLSSLAATLSSTYRRAGKRWDSIRLAAVACRLWPLNKRAYRSSVLSLISLLGKPRNKWSRTSTLKSA